MHTPRPLRSLRSASRRRRFCFLSFSTTFTPKVHNVRTKGEIECTKKTKTTHNNNTHTNTRRAVHTTNREAVDFALEVCGSPSVLGSLSCVVTSRVHVMLQNESNRWSAKLSFFFFDNNNPFSVAHTHAHTHTCTHTHAHTRKQRTDAIAAALLILCLCCFFPFCGCLLL